MSSKYMVYCGTSHSDMQVLYAPGVSGDEYACYDICWKPEMNAAGELTFTLPQSHWAYSKMKSFITLVEIRIQLSDDTVKVIWEGRVYSMERDFYNQKTVKCEGALAYLSDTIQSYTRSIFVEKATTKLEFVKAILYGYTDESGETHGHNSQSGTRAMHPGNIDGTVGAMTPSVSDIDLESYVTSLELLQRVFEDDNVIIDMSYGTDSTTGEWRRYLNVWAADASSEGMTYDQVIEFGDNMLDLNETIVPENIVNCIRPFGALTDEEIEDPTIEDRLRLDGGTSGTDAPAELETYSKTYLYGYYKASDPKDIRYSNAHSDYQIPPIWQVVTFDDISDRIELLTAAENYLHNYILKTVSIDVSAVDMNYAGDESDNIITGRYYRCYSAPHGFDEVLLCSAATIYPQDPAKNSYTLGYSGKTLSDDLFAQSNDLHNSRQAVQLLKASNKWSIQAAKAAQTTANTAVQNAATAQQTANTAVENAATAQSTANTAVTNAATAQATAEGKSVVSVSAKSANPDDNGYYYRNLYIDGGLACTIVTTN